MTAVYLLGAAANAAQTGYNGDNNGYVSFNRYQAGVSGVIDSVQIKYGTTTGKYIKVAIYSDNAGEPGSRLAYSDSVVVNSSGWKSVALNSTVSIASGTYYWVVVSWEGGTSTNTVAYKTDTIYIQRYKTVTYSSYTFPETYNGSGFSSNTNRQLCAAWGAISITIDVPCAASSSAAFNPAVTGGALSTPPLAASTSTAYAPTAGSIVESLPPLAAGSSLAFVPTLITIQSFMVIAPLSMSASAAFAPTAGPLLSVTIAAPLAASASRAYTVSFFVPFHVILEASYEAETQEINRTFVVGQDTSGSPVSGNSITQAEVDLVGERLEVQHTPEASTSVIAGYIAAAVLAKSRLDSKKGQITIPPHCGLELWDVINIADDGCNQSGDYRVSGYTLDYDVRDGRYSHKLELCDK